MPFLMLSSYILTLLLVCPYSNIIALEYTQQCNNECTPRSGNLLVGRSKFIEASSTCGLDNVTNYCVYSLRDGVPAAETCDLCYSKEPYTTANTISHQVENVVHEEYPIDGKQWWQSENGVENVTLKLTLETEFLFISTRLSFRTYVPAAMYIEKTIDDTTWKPIAYFSNQCERDFPHVPARARNSPDDVTCISHLSSHTISQYGLVEFSLIPPQLVEGSNIHPHELMLLQKFVALRIQFVRLNKLGDEYVDKSTAINKKYYYAVQEWVVQGRCSCHGHAAACRPNDTDGNLNLKMVYGTCLCQHHTMGDNCEVCQEFYRDHPWRPAIGSNANECRECRCNNHTTKCHFNPTRYYYSGNVSGGECDDCQHHTVGVNCEACESGYYRNPDVPHTSNVTCLPCDCYGPGLKSLKPCQQETSLEPKIEAGQCNCRPNVGGRRCDTCKVGYWNLNSDNPDGCQRCACERLGSLNNAGCDQHTGICTCKKNVMGSLCNVCKPGHYNLSTHTDGCQECNCYEAGTRPGETCDSITGICPCRSGFEGRDCSRVQDGWHVSILATVLAPVGAAYPTVMKPPREGGRFTVVIHVNVTGFAEHEIWTVQLDVVQASRGNECPPDPRNVDIRASERILVLSQVCISSWSEAAFQLTAFSAPIESTGKVELHLIQVFPEESPRLTELCEPYRYYEDDTPPSCKEYPLDNLMNVVAYRELSSQECNCDIRGSMSNVCNKFSGQCKCKLGVTGRTCNKCKPYHWGFSIQGCTRCDCDANGSKDQNCHPHTGVCNCRPNYTGDRCDQCQAMHFNFPSCTACDCNGLATACDKVTGECIGCKDNTDGEKCQYCKYGYYGDPVLNVPCLPCNCSLPNNMGAVNNSIGCALLDNGLQCYCNEEAGYEGSRCDQCMPGFYGDPLRGTPCRKCECSGNIDMNDRDSCDRQTGECLKCLRNTDGARCDKCKDGYYRNMHMTTISCVPCVCRPRYSKPNTFCDAETGQCQCIDNAIGLTCEECKKNHYYSMSHKKCVPCNCSGEGSTSEQCDSLTGDCHCKPNYGGRRCHECPFREYGTPGNCKKCSCEWRYAEGCDQKTGACKCQSNFFGPECDKCADNTEGDFPNCKQCGPCYDGWKQELQRLSDLYNVSHGVNVTSPAFKQLLHLLDKKESASCGSIRCRDFVNALLQIQELINTFPNASSRIKALIQDLLKEEKELIYFLQLTVPNFSESFINIRRNISLVQDEINKLLSGTIRGPQVIAEIALNETDTVEIEKNHLRRLRDLLKYLEEQLSFRRDVGALSQNATILLNELKSKLDFVEEKLCGRGNLIVCNKNLGARHQELNRSLSQLTSQNVSIHTDSVSLKEKLDGVGERVHEVRELSKLLLQKAVDIRDKDASDGKRYEELQNQVEEALRISENVTDAALQQLEQSITAITNVTVDPEVARNLANDINILLRNLTYMGDVIRQTETRRNQSKDLLNEALQLKKETEETFTKSANLKEMLQNVSKILNNSETFLRPLNESLQTYLTEVAEAENRLAQTKDHLEKSGENLANVNATLQEMENLLHLIQSRQQNTTDILTEAEEIVGTLQRQSSNQTHVNWARLQRELNQTSEAARAVEAELGNLQQKIDSLESTFSKLNGKMDLDHFEDTERVIREIAFETILTCNIGSFWTE